MYIKRDITPLLQSSPALIQVLLGPRQCGKSTLFAALYPMSEHTASSYNEVTFDDLQMRQLANTDPALFLQQFGTPLLLDEVQYVPNLFPELKKTIDQIKLKNLKQTMHAKSPEVMYRLTGSNQILMDRNVKESLAGRASYFHLNTLSVHEIIHSLPNTPLKEIIFKGGWPELYTNPNLSVTQYLNDYIRSYVEKDIALSSGIQKLAEFFTVLRLCAARTGQELDYSDIQKDSGASAVTVKEWISMLERADLLFLLKPYFNNLNKRLIKRPKIFFLDTGLAVRLQGWSDAIPLMNSPQIGGVFETLALAEIVKFIRNYGKDWEVFFARTKDGQEVDFIIKTAAGRFHLFEVKYAIHGISKAIACPPAFKTEFGKDTKLTVITSGGERLQLSQACMLLPIMQLHDYLHTIDMQ